MSSVQGSYAKVSNTSIIYLRGNEGLEVAIDRKNLGRRKTTTGEENRNETRTAEEERCFNARNAESWENTSNRTRKPPQPLLEVDPVLSQEPPLPHGEELETPCPPFPISAVQMFVPPWSQATRVPTQRWGPLPN